MRELTLKAERDNVIAVTEFIDKELEALECNYRAQMQIDVAIDEVFSNVAFYAYGEEVGEVTVRFEFDEASRTAALTFIDRGKPFDPLAKEDPDTTLSAEERKIGGLGIFMVKKTMDSVEYEYKDGFNMLTIKKTI